MHQFATTVPDSHERFVSKWLRWYSQVGVDERYHITPYPNSILKAYQGTQKPPWLNIGEPMFNFAVCRKCKSKETLGSIKWVLECYTPGCQWSVLRYLFVRTRSTGPLTYEIANGYHSYSAGQQTILKASLCQLLAQTCAQATF